MAPLSPSSSTMPEGPLSPESAASNSQRQQYPSYEEDETMTDFACAMFSPRNWKAGDEQNDIVDDEEKMNIEDDTSPRSLCSCNNDVEGVEPIQYTTKKIAANGSKDDPPSEKSLITPDSEDSEDNTVSDDNVKPNDKETLEEPKAKKGVTWVEKNPTPLSPMSHASSSIISPRNGNNKRRGGSMLSPREEDEETLTLEENDTLDEDDDDQKPTGLLAASKNRRPGSIHNHPAEAKRKQSVVPPTMVDIPDDESEASLLVLMRYMGCTPVAYGEGPLPNNRLDDSGNTRPSFVFDSGSYDEDENSLLSDDDDTFVELEKQEIEDIKTSWTMDNNEVGVEMGLSDLVIDVKKEETNKKKKKKKSLVVDVEQDISDAPSDEKGNATSPLVGSGSPIVKFATSPNSGRVVVPDDDGEQDLGSSKVNNGAIASPASSRSFAITSPRDNEEVTKAMAEVAAYKKSMAEVNAPYKANEKSRGDAYAAALSETEKINFLLASLKTPVSGSAGRCFSRQTSAVPHSTAGPVATEAAPTDVKPVKPAEESSPPAEDDTKIKKTSSSRSDKENGGGISPTAELNGDVAATIAKAPLTVDTASGAKSPQDAPDSSTSSKALSPTSKKSVKEVDELLSKTREWLVRHNETQHKKLATPLATPSVATSNESPVSSKRKVMGDITVKTVLNPESADASNGSPSVLSPLSLGNGNKGDVTSPKTLDQLLQSKKNGTASSSNTALLSAAAKLASPKSLAASPTSLLSSPTSTTGGAGGEPKKSIMEQLEEIRSKQRELEARQKAKQERLQQLQQQEA